MDPSKDRLSPECKEPKGPDYETYAGGFGPAKIFCCETAKKVLADLEYRCHEECNDAHPCSKALEEIHCPRFIKKYTEEKEKVCKPRPTTTTTLATTTTAPTTIAPAPATAPAAAPAPAQENEDKSEKCKAHGDEKQCGADSDCKWDGKACVEDSLAWCYKMCGEIAQPTDECKNEDACKKFCTEAAKKFNAKD